VTVEQLFELAIERPQNAADKLDPSRMRDEPRVPARQLLFDAHSKLARKDWGQFGHLVRVHGGAT
jgi:hypothetical protein